MLTTKYGMDITNEELRQYLSLLKNKVYKLLPLREEGLQWEKHLTTVLIEINGLDSLINSNKINILEVAAKLEGLFTLEDFSLYRKTIFECLNTIDDLGR